MPYVTTQKNSKTKPTLVSPPKFVAWKNLGQVYPQLLENGLVHFSQGTKRFQKHENYAARVKIQIWDVIFNF